ncbi:MAG: formate dehydrogenase accessory sulfurtransferase FdhD [Coriobacteriia bacterium]|nr:formate dehydrogenase accessory sulfurtransferase FdhD [Coriobacteriia bacterium]
MSGGKDKKRGVGAQDRIPLTAAVLAGGRSLRMGVDKTLLDVEGKPLVARVVAAVQSVCAHTLVVTNRPEMLEDVGLPVDVPVTTDEVAYQGPLGGLVTAMGVAEDEWVLAVAADMPWLEPELIRALWDARDAADVVLPVSERGPEPLLALYRSEACLPAARAALSSGRRRLVAIFGGLRVIEVPVADLREADPELRSLVNVNTPEELAEVREHAFPPAAEEVAKPRLKVMSAGSRRGRGMPVERPITIHMNDVEVATVQATPSDLEEMAAGFLISEGLMRDRSSLDRIDVDAKRGMVWVVTGESVPDDMVFRTRYVTSGCGKGVTFSSVGHARGLAHVESTIAVSSEVLYDMMGQMARAAEAYRGTGGVHSCALGRDGTVLLVREDVGRHSALDKLLGRAWLDGIPTEDAVLLSTGRISYEMAVKAAKSRVPIVVSRTAVTDLAADIAQELGITLVGYARGGQLVVYTCPERVAIVDEEA